MPLYLMPYKFVYLPIVRSLTDVLFPVPKYESPTNALPTFLSFRHSESRERIRNSYVRAIVLPSQFTDQNVQIGTTTIIGK